MNSLKFIFVILLFLLSGCASTSQLPIHIVDVGNGLGQQVSMSPSTSENTPVQSKKTLTAEDFAYRPEQESKTQDAPQQSGQGVTTSTSKATASPETKMRENTPSFSSTNSARITELEEQVLTMGRRACPVMGFNSGSAVISKEGKAELDRVNWSETKVLRIPGFASEGGTVKKNRQLSIDRANAVAKYIASAGADMSDHTLVGYGTTKRFGNTRADNQAVLVIYKAK